MRERLDEALELYLALEQAEPEEARWPHRRGDLLRRRGREADAVDAYTIATHKYADLGFVARAIAMAKVAVGLDPSRADLLDALDPEAARRVVRAQRPAGIGAAEDGSPSAARASLPETATKLQPAQDADDDEIRFEDASEADFIELDLSELELLPPSPRGDLTPATDEITADTLALLPAMPLFAEMPRPALAKLAADALLVHCADGEIIVRAGDAADCLFAIVEGRARVRVPELGADMGALLDEGDVFGEACLLEDVRRRADVFAVGDVIALSIEKATLDALVAEFPRIEEMLLSLLTRRLLSNLLRTSVLFAAFSPEIRHELAALFEVRRADEGTVFVERGKRSDGLYVVLTGRVVREDPDGSQRSLSAGSIFGQRSLIAHEPALARLSASTEVLVLRLPSTAFNRVASEYPPVLAHIADLASQGDDVIDGQPLS